MWDAGECLQLTNWNDRRIYTHDFDNNVFRIAEPNGAPSAQFIALVEQLDGEAKIDPPLSDDADEKSAQIVAMAEWLLGRNMPEDWKLSGLPNSAPILIRRVPQANADFRPSVGIRDPHCAGRRNAVGDDVPFDGLPGGEPTGETGIQAREPIGSRLINLPRSVSK